MNKLYLFILLVLLAQTVQTHAQPITLNVNNVSLDTVFARIQEQTPYRFVYTSEEMAGTRKVSFSVQKAPINTVLSLSFKDQPLDYSMEDPYIYVRKKEESKKPPPPPNQTTEIRGKITNEQGDPLEGATVQINQLGVRTLTNAKGEFLLRIIPNGAYQLEVTFVGYEKYTAMAKADPNGPPLTITMKRSINNLDETVIKGYYATTNRLNTGDVTTVKGEDIEKQPVSDPILALEGRVPGLYIQQTSGIPGAYSSILLRGQNSIANGNNPLFVVDGVPYTSNSLTVWGGAEGSPTSSPGGGVGGMSPFNGLNPADIESIEVLKDADATAIYGSRGANGVILITTKKGKAGQTLVDANVYSGAGKITRTVKMLNTQQYLEIRHEAFNNDGNAPGPTDYDVNGTWDTTRYTDWQRVLIGNAASFTNAQLNLSGGNVNTQFMAGVGYSTQGTVYPGHYSDKKASGHISMTHSSMDGRFHFQFISNYVNDNSKLPVNDLTGQINLAPDAPPVYNSNGSLNWEVVNGTATFNPNPLSYTLLKAQAITNNFINNASLSYLIAKGLQLKSSFGYSHQQMNETNLYPASADAPPNNNNPSFRSSEFSTNDLSTWIIEPQLNYQTQVSKGKLEALVGTTFQQNEQRIDASYAYGFPSDALISDPTAASGYGLFKDTHTLYHYDAAFGRLSYNWDDKYILNATARRDGSSRFGPGRQFGNFSAIGAAWIFSGTKFIKDQVPFLSFGKLRASYGTTGNDQIADYGYLSTYSLNGYSYQGLSGLYATSPSNPDYGWEVVKKLEAGLELGFMRNRLRLTASYYRNQDDNQLVGYPLPSYTGFTSVQTNLAAIVQNSGAEFFLTSINITSRDLAWSSSINLSIPVNKLVAYPGLSNSAYQYRYVVGKPLFIQMVYQSVGVDPQTGIYSFVTKNSGGQPSFPQDLAVSKPLTQLYYGGIQNRFAYKGLSVDFLIQFVKQNGYGISYSLSTIPGVFNHNLPVSDLDHWRKPGDMVHVQMMTENFANPAVNAFFNYLGSNAVIGDASFVRLKNLAISYQLPMSWMKASRLQSGRVYLQCQNLFTITKYQGLDPETGGLNLPPLRMTTGGIQISL